MKYLLILLVAFSFPAWAVTHPDEKLRDPALEARALHLTQTLRCVVCQNESIEESNADIARDLRILVRSQILAGKTDAEIVTGLRTSYGDFILLNPPMDRRTYALWLMPVLVLAAGLFMMIPAMRIRKKKK